MKTTDNSSIKKIDPKGVNAQKMLAMFLDSFNVLNNYIYEAETIDNIAEALVDICGTKDDKTMEIFDSLSAMLCDCFCKFLSECPNIHVTID